MVAYGHLKRTARLYSRGGCGGRGGAGTLGSPVAGDTETQPFLSWCLWVSPCGYPTHSTKGQNTMSQNTPKPLTTDIILRDVLASDLSIFFEQQLDADANHMAAFTAKNPANRDAFMLHWARILGDETITIKTILFAGQVAGHILSYEYEEFAQ